MPLPTWTRETSLNEKLDHLRAGVEELLGDRWTPQYGAPPPPDDVPANQALSSFTPDQIAALRQVLGLGNPPAGSPPGQSTAQPGPSVPPAPSGPPEQPASPIGPPPPLSPAPEPARQELAPPGERTGPDTSPANRPDTDGPPNLSRATTEGSNVPT